MKPIEDKVTYYSANSDYRGRDVVANQEIVNYHADLSLRIWFNEQTDSYPAHWHQALEIILPVENFYDVEINGSEYHLLPGEILIIPPGEMHMLKAPDSGKRFIFLFDMTNISRFRGFSTIQSLMMQPIRINKTDYTYIYDDMYRLLMQIRNEYFSEGEYREIVIYSHLMNFFVNLGRNHLENNHVFSGSRVYKQKEYLQKFNDILEYIDEHYMDELTLESVAASIGYSKYHFTRLFKQFTDSTFYDYLSFKRLKVAESLLAQPDLSITEIALRSGFSSISTFNRIFRQQKDCTPSEYRAMCKLHQQN